MRAVNALGRRPSPLAQQFDARSIVWLSDVCGWICAGLQARQGGKGRRTWSCDSGPLYEHLSLNLYTLDRKKILPLRRRSNKGRAAGNSQLDITPYPVWLRLLPSGRYIVF